MAHILGQQETIYKYANFVKLIIYRESLLIVVMATHAMSHYIHVIYHTWRNNMLSKECLSANMSGNALVPMMCHVIMMMVMVM